MLGSVILLYYNANKSENGINQQPTVLKHYSYFNVFLIGYMHKVKDKTIIFKNIVFFKGQVFKGLINFAFKY